MKKKITKIKLRLIRREDLKFVYQLYNNNVLEKKFFSNKTVSFRVLAQIASAVPKRVKFSKIEYNGSDLIVIEGTAFSDQDILKLISNLNNKKLISQASLASMTLPQGQQQGTQTMKGFKVACVLEQI